MVYVAATNKVPQRSTDWMRMNARAEDDLQIRIARDERDKQAAFRLRYEVYVGEQQKRYTDADHKLRLLSDEYDARSTLLMAERNGQICGAVRSNTLNDPLVRSRFAELLQVDRFARIPLSSMSLCSRLTIAETARRACTARILLEGIYDFGLLTGTVLCFATCAPPILRIFRKYGSREYAPPVIDPAAGLLHRTVLVLDDLAHLAAVGSPLLAVAEYRSIRAIKRDWLATLLADGIGACAV